jgi:hypothetical protein
MKFSARAESAARSLLNETNEARSAVDATLASFKASLARLAEAKSAPAAVESELATLDATEAAQMAAWSREAAGSPMPQPDAERRDELDRALRSARSAAAAAAAAETSLTAEAARESAKLAGIETHAKAAAARVILETAEAMIDELVDTAKSLARMTKNLEIGRMLGLVTIESVGDLSIARDSYAALGEFDRRFDSARGVWPTDPVAAEKSIFAWRQFAQDLRDDAHVFVDSEAT